ncbi:hypothetical protein LLG96_03045 [bacterium]|nr:hypothetical protein [bacterium]
MIRKYGKDAKKLVEKVRKTEGYKGMKETAINLKSAAIASVVVLACFSCSHMEKKPVDMPLSITIVPFDVTEIRPIPGEEHKCGPRFVSIMYPSPSSVTLQFYFHLPAAARTRIDLCNNADKVVSTMIDKRMQKGAYKLIIDNSYIIEPGKYTLKLLVDTQIVGTRNFTIIK